MLKLQSIRFLTTAASTKPGLVAFVFVVVFLGFGMPLVCNLVCFVPPAAISLTAFLDKSVSSAEQQFLKANWMTYWVIFGLFTALETFRAAILYVFPYYYAFKVAVLVWCMSPTWRGAAFIYDHGLKDLVTNKQPLPPPPPPSSSSAKAAIKE